MRLYYSPGSIAVAAAIALHEADLPFEAVPVDFKSADQTKPAYLALNPKGRVPTLDVDGHLLTETGAILDYIATVAPQAGLMPADPLAAAHVRSVMYYVASTLHVNHAHKMRGTRWADQPDSHADMTAKVPQTMAQSARFVEDHCLRGDYVAGDTLSVADPYLFVGCSWLDADGVALDHYPLIAAFLERMRARASVRRVIVEGILPA